MAERTVSEHFFCLRDWLLSAPANFFNDKKLLRTIFQAIERGLTPNEFAGAIAVDDKKEEDPAQSSKRKKDKKDTKKKDAKDEVCNLSNNNGLKLIDRAGQA